MQTRPVTADDLASSVIATPPLARDADLNFSPAENDRIIAHIESGRIRHLLYGGNANFYHIRPSEYRAVLEHLAGAVGAQTIVTPAVGPTFGMMMEQAATVRELGFPSSLVLPMEGGTDEVGVAAGLRRYAEAAGHPIVLCIKRDGYLAPEGAAGLVEDGLVAWIKYATVRDEPREDPYLERLSALVDPNIIVSGLGEQPAMVHITRFGTGSFTTGCGCVAPALSQWMLEAIRAGHFAKAEELRRVFGPLEDLRNGIGPIRVLHEAVGLAGIADTGLLPLLSNISPEQAVEVGAVAAELLTQND